VHATVASTIQRAYFRKKLIPAQPICCESRY
jgi:hypothetical protein